MSEMWRHPYFRDFLYISGRSGNVFSDCGAKDTVLSDLSIAVKMLRKASTMSNNANCNATVQVLLELGDLYSCFTEYGGFQFSGVLNVHKHM